ncbi:MAG: 3-hydroxyacyl-CoA dehydrogenase family protein [Pseudoxanthomonas sp.]
MLKSVQPNGVRDFSDAEIVERMMLPLVNEAVRCLDEGVAATPTEIDMALLLGLGMPQYTGGALKYADWLGLDRVLAWSDRHAALGAMWTAPASLRERAAAGKGFY